MLIILLAFCALAFRHSLLLTVSSLVVRESCVVNLYGRAADVVVVTILVVVVTVLGVVVTILGGSL